MKYNLLLIANKPGVALSMMNVEYNSSEAAEKAVQQMRDQLKHTNAFDLTYFITQKGREVL